MQEAFLVHKPELVNVVGHAAGAVIFAIFVYLCGKDRAGAQLRGSRLSLAAGVLALVWDALSLVVLLSPPGWGGFSRLMVTASFAALSLLPAVLFHLGVARHRVLIGSGYAVSSVAVGLHAAGFVLDDRRWVSYGLWLLTVGFVFLTAAAAVLWSRERADWSRRLVATMSLLLLALSLAHLAEWPSSHDWRFEILLHHASVPLALFILLQDYRFLLLDAFVRFLANVLLAGLMVFGATQVLRAWPGWDEEVRWVMAGGALLLFGALRSRVEAGLGHLFFRRPDVEGAVEALREAGEGASTESEYLEAARRIVSEHWQAKAVAWRERLDLAYPALSLELGESVRQREVEVVTPLRFANGEMQALGLGRREGGQRYLSEDLKDLARLADVIEERVDQLRTMEMQRLVAQAELQALEAQIHPHFLFNALNTLYGVIPREAGEARRTVLNLADILRYFLQEGKTLIPLEEELRIVRAYLEIEALRLGGKLRTELDIDPRALAEPIPILSVEPLVENAVKHGVATRSGPGWVKVTARMREAGLEIEVRDSGAGFGRTEGVSKGAGVGLANVRRRLELCYGGAAELRIESDGEGTRVGFTAPVTRAVETVR